MKKVFRTWKFLKHELERFGDETFAKDINYLFTNRYNWCLILEGLTPEEINNLGYLWRDEWLVEEE